ncbi:hypothetical protein FHS90_001278 [Rufibacter quisquiliarum]|uniref:Uncharacterized protein n=1 Tax=Rufibacter quisquiliarum TaxID=1549639 RepID=A0A839GCC3_9BACT|nr:hypothetical protein [Rufibacter quisquiliarum]
MCILALQALLLFRVAVPAFHTLLHGLEEPATQTSALCSLSKAAAEREEPRQAAPLTKSLLADMLPTHLEEYTFHSLVMEDPVLPLFYGIHWSNSSLPIFTPPPQA